MRRSLDRVAVSMMKHSHIEALLQNEFDRYYT